MNVCSRSSRTRVREFPEPVWLYPIGDAFVSEHSQTH
jgi:hypothetical protein